ncbi:MAG: sugar ABC transporter permease [Chloroflexota bacterium]|nr:sugar ABC transporter permease [Chloroflexota bacterium]
MTDTLIRPEGLRSRAPTAGLTGKFGQLGTQIRKNAIAYIFLAPAFILMGLFLVYPIVQSLLLSFYEWNGIAPRVYVGLENFERLLQDKILYLAIGNNIIFSIFTTTGTVTLGFLLALSIERQVRGWRIFKVAYFLPVMVSGTVVGLLWEKLLDPTFGAVNLLLKALGVENPPVWLGDPVFAMVSLIIVTIWQYAGFPMIIFLAAMENIPQEIHDSATLDGVTWQQRATKIIMPLISNVTMTIILLQLIFSFKVFDIVWTMTGGGPGEATNVLAVYLYRTAFRFTEFGYGSAIAVIMFVIIFVLSNVYLRIFRPEHVEY